MKNVIKLVVLLFATVSFSQTNDAVNLEDVKVHTVDISVNVNSEEEVKSTFTMKDIKTLLSEVQPNEALNFEITCIGEDKSVGEPSTLTYRVKGDSNNPKVFLERVKKVRNAVIKFYKNKY